MLSFEYPKTLGELADEWGNCDHLELLDAIAAVELQNDALQSEHDNLESQNETYEYALRKVRSILDRPMLVTDRLRAIMLAVSDALA